MTGSRSRSRASASSPRFMSSCPSTSGLRLDDRRCGLGRDQTTRNWTKSSQGCGCRIPALYKCCTRSMTSCRPPAEWACQP
jgi:hypothetical protein